MGPGGILRLQTRGGRRHLLMAHTCELHVNLKSQGEVSMNKNKRIWVAATFALAAFAMAVPRVEAERRAEVIYEWNQLLQQSTAGPPFSQARTYAITHIAMADAVVAI